MALPKLDKWQYRLCREIQPGGIRIGAFWLEVDPGLPAFPLMDVQGKSAGWILGHPIDFARERFLDGPVTLPAGFDAGDPDQVLRFLWSLGGIFLVLLDRPDGLWAYPDASAHIPLVYDRVTGNAGASAHALLADPDYEDRRDHALTERLGVGGEGWLPAGFTAHHDIVRLLPNHRIRLDDGRTERFWPRGPVPTTTDPDAMVAETVHLLRAQVAAMEASGKRPALGLTGGTESRSILAACRTFLGRMDIVTVTRGGDRPADTIISARIAVDMGIPRRELPRLTATPEQTALFIRRGGHAIGDTNSLYHPSVWPIADSHIFIGGVGGEVGRAFFWRASDTPATAITAVLLNGRFGLPQTPQLIEALEAWLAGLPPGLDAYGILDLAYIEHRMGPWYAMQITCDPTLLRIHPLFTFRGVELLLSLPPDWKRASRLGPEMIRTHWPELMNYPFNSLGKVQDMWAKVRRALRDPAVVMKKLRKLRY